MIVSCNNITVTFGVDIILQDVSFHVNDGERAAIVGINGAGKSTLLNVVTGQLHPDEGEIAMAKGATVGYLTQRQDLTSERTIWEEVLDARRDVLDAEADLRRLEQEMKSVSGEALEQKLHTYTRLTHEFENKNGYALRSEAGGILKGLGYGEDEWSHPICNLSGGQKTRVALGKLLLQNPALIILDEPTNHLDVASIMWLENYLTGYHGTVLVVSHDRYFLNRIATKIIEIEHTKARTYQGNYSDYADKKAKRREDALKQYQNQQNEIRHQEEVIAKLRSFNREKSIKRAESREKMLAKVERLERPVTKERAMHVRFTPRITSGNDVLTVGGLSKSYDGRRIFENLSFELKRGERIALIGANGTGKTTILKAVNQLIPAEFEELRLGAMVKVAYYDQEHQVLSDDKVLFDELRDAHPTLNDTQLRNVLAAFLFTGDDVFKRVGDLSGGEKGRMSLAKLMLCDANFLILDEPTNHLDVTSKEILEDALSSYAGTVLYVSHDRYFVNRTATGILHLEGGRLTKYWGDYDYFMEKWSEAAPEQGQSADAAPTIDDDSSKASWMQKKEEQANARKLQNALARAEDEIHRLEQEVAELDALMTRPEVATNAAKLLEYDHQKSGLQAQLDDWMEQWESLSEEME